MKIKRFTIILGVLLLLLMIAPVSLVLAAPPFDTVVESGETIQNDVVLFDGDIEVAEGAVVNGNVTLFNGSASIAGTVKGDVVLFNGNLDAAETAEILGDCVLLNGNLNDATEAGLACTAVEGLSNLVPALASIGDLPVFSDLPGRSDVHLRMPSPIARFFSNLAQAAARSLVLGFLAFVTASLLPHHLENVAGAVRRKPVATGVVGLLTAVAVPSLVALLLPVSIILLFVCIGLLGFPLMLALLLGLGAGALLGWITVGNMLGQRLAGPLKLRNQSLPVTAVVGTMVMTFAISLMGFGEGAVAFLVICVGLGGAALTKLGTKPYPLARITNQQKVTTVLETLPVADVTTLKENE